MTRQLLAACLALCASACDGLGEPIVDEFPRPRMGPGYDCSEPLITCDQPYLSQAPYPPAALPQLPCPMRDGPRLNCDPVQTFQSDCALTVSVLEGVPVRLAGQSCTLLDLSPAPGSDRLELVGVSVRGDLITLHADAPTTFVFSGAQLTLSRIVLSGPITLEFTDQSLLDGVSIQSEDEVDVTLRESVFRGSVALLSKGSLRGLRSTFSDSQLHVRELTLETVELSMLKVTAERMVGIELKGSTLQLDVVDASFSELELSKLTLDRCGTALFVNARLSAPTFEPCTVGSLHTDSSALMRGRVRGNVQSRDSIWQEMLVGAGDEFQLWGGSLSGDVMCPGLQRLTISEPITVACNDCRALAAAASVFCSAEPSDAGMPVPDVGTLPDSGVLDQKGNPLCPVLDELLPWCNPRPVDRSPF